MRYSFEETTFARLNTVGEQLDHIMSEVDEIEQIGPGLDAVLDDEAASAALRREIELEVMDLLHSCETFFRILERERGKDYVEHLQIEVAMKNQERGYYEAKA